VVVAEVLRGIVETVALEDLIVQPELPQLPVAVVLAGVEAAFHIRAAVVAVALDF
jgi:hypothetical protein